MIANSWFRKLDVSSELWGGAAAALVALPSAIAFGVIIYSPLGPEYVAQGAMAGILGAIALGLVAPIFGGCPRLITAPCAPAAVLMVVFVEGLRENGIERILLLMTLVTLMTGALQFLYGSLRAGRLIKFIPYPVVSGYLTAVGIKILDGQLPNFFGVAKGESWYLPANWKVAGVIVGCVTAGGMVFGPRVTKKVPAAIIGLAAGVLTYFALGFLAYPELLQLNSAVVGMIDAGGGFWSGFKDRWVALGDLRLADMQLLAAEAVTLSVLLSIDTLKTCVVVDALTRSRHDSNRELFGQGISNIAAGLVGGIPGAGTMGATLVNVNSGGKTRLSSFAEGMAVLVACLLLTRVIAWVPIAALAGILIVVAFRMVDWKSLHLLKQKATTLDFVVILVVVVVAVFKGLIAAAGAGLALAIFLFVRELVRGSVIRRKVYGHQISSKRHRLPEEKEHLHNFGAMITVCELQGSLFFGTTDQLFTELEADLKMSRYVILDLRKIQSVDFTAAHMLEQIEAMLAERNGQLIFSSLPAIVPTRQDLRAYFSQVGLIKPTQNVRLFDSLDAALEWAEDRVLEDQRLLKDDQDKPLELPEIELLRQLESEDVLCSLRRCAVERTYAEGETIFSKGDDGDELFLIRRGIVRILLPLDGGRHYNLASFARGNFFGDMTFLDRSVRSADAVAVTPTDLYAISRRDFDRLSEQHPLMAAEIFAHLARALAVRLRYTNSELRSLQDA